MADLTASHKWVFTSTGTGDPFNVRPYSQGITLGIESSSGCTGVTQILHRMGPSTGPFSVISTIVSTLGEFTTDQFMGPLEWIAPRVTDKTASTATTITVYLQGNG